MKKARNLLQSACSHIGEREFISQIKAEDLPNIFVRRLYRCSSCGRLLPWSTEDGRLAPIAGNVEKAGDAKKVNVTHFFKGVAA